MRIYNNKKSTRKNKEENKRLGNAGEDFYAEQNRYAKREVTLSSKNFYGRADFIENNKVIEIKATASNRYKNPEDPLMQLYCYMYMNNKIDGLLMVYYVPKWDSKNGDFRKIEKKFHIKVSTDKKRMHPENSSKYISIYEKVLAIDEFISEIKQLDYIKFKSENIREAFRVRKKARKDKKAKSKNF